MATKNNEKLLSEVMDEFFVETREEVDIIRKSFAVFDSINSKDVLTIITTGSHGDGFNMLCSDLDRMLILQHMVVMYQETKQELFKHSGTKTVLLIKEDLCRPGFVNLKISQIGEFTTKLFRNAMVPIFNSFFLSSDIFREEIMSMMKTLGYDVVSTGPSNKISTRPKMKQDCVTAIFCCNWPHDAHEWINRSRPFNWPTKCMITEIMNKGCHVVPVGDKCSDDTLLQWRISFAIAEKYLVHSLNHIQFKVYGLLKYLLKQIKYRMKHDTGDDELLCSYFMKTLLFFAAENSPKSLWQEKNIFLCYQFCLTMLLDWVHCGYCPNYFIITSNMFQKKLQGGNRKILVNILCELKDMKWQSLSIGSSYLPSIWNLMQIPSVQKSLMRDLSSTEKECMQDTQIFRCIRDGCDDTLEMCESIRKAMALLSKSVSEVDEVFVYCAVIHLLEQMSMQRYRPIKALNGNKLTYVYLRKYREWMSKSFGTEKLYLATLFYHTGTYRKAIELCRNVISSIYLYANNSFIMVYKDMYCGKGYPFIHKLKQAYAHNIRFHTNNLQFCLPHLHMEVCSQRPHALCIPPKPYAMFLIFMCQQDVGDTERRDKTLHYLETSTYDETIEERFHWIVYTMIGICYETKGDQCNAIKAYQNSLLSNRNRNPAKERISLLQSSVSVVKLKQTINTH